MAGHIFAPEILREYDIRGIVGESLTAHDAFILGRSLGKLFNGASSKMAVVGRDGRHSSPYLCEELIHGLSLSGLNVMDIGVVASPMLYFANHVLKADLGVMVTGSHNDAGYNGFKMVLHGKSFYGKDIKRLAEIARFGLFASGYGQVVQTSINDAYLQRIIADYQGSRFSAKGLRVGWDPGNGAFGPTTKALTKLLKGTHFLINDEIDGDFPAHHPDPTIAENLVQLQQLVAANTLDIGIGFDGDGDRIGLVDDRGRIVWGDQILMLLAKAILPHCPPNSPVIYDVKASNGLGEVLAELGAKPVMSPTGHSIIKTKMAQLDAPLAGEMSGHIFIKHLYYGYDDALYVALRLLNFLETSPYKLSELVDQLPKFVNTPELRVDVSEAEKFALIDKLAEKVADYPPQQVNKMDGLRVDETDGWWLVRASNTQPCLVVRCEAKDQAGLDAICKKLAHYLTQLGIKPPF